MGDDKQKRHRAKRAPASSGGSTGSVPAAGWRERRSAWFWPLAIIVVIALLFAPLVFGGKVFSSPDAQAPQGFAVYAADWQRETGTYPLWNPFIFCGMQSFGSLSFNPGVYPPDWLFMVLGGLAPPMLWLIVYYMLGGVALYVFLRDRGATAGAAALGGLVFAMTPNLIAVGAHGHGSQLVCSAWIPVVLLCVHRFLARGGWHWLGGAALAIGMQLLRAHIQIAYYTWIAVGLYLVFYWIDARKPGSSFQTRPLRGTAGVLLALVLGFALAAVLVLPVMGYTPLSIRGGGETGGVSFEYATGWSMGWRELTTVVVPGALGFGGATYWGSMPFTDYPNAYMGVLPLFFLVMGLVLRSRGSGYFIALGIAGLAIALGRHFVVYQVLYDFLPYFKKFRVPVMILVLFHLAGAAVLALGVTAFLAWARSSPEAARRRLAGRLRITGIAGLAACVVLLLLGGAFTRSYTRSFTASPRIQAMVAGERLSAGDAAELGHQAAGRAHGDLVRNLLILSLAAVGAALVAQRKLRAELYVVLLAVLVAVDLVPIDRRIMAPMIQPRAVLERVTEPDPVTRFLSAQPTESFRIYPIEEFGANRFATFGISSIGGYHAAKPRLYQDYMEAVGIDNYRVLGSPQGFRQLDFLAVRYVVTSHHFRDDSGRLAVALEGPVRVYENRGALPRAFLVGAAEVLPPGPATLARMIEPDFDPARLALVAEDPGALGGATVEGSAEIAEFGLNGIAIAVESSGPALLVTSEGYDPGWRAWVDGHPAPVLQANHAFRAVRVPAGAHRVEMRYEDRRLTLGLAISVAAAVACLGLVGFGLLGERRRRQPAAE